VLNRVNLSLWTASAGDQATSLFYGLIDTRSDQLRCASAGDLGIIHLRSRRWRSTIRNTPPLGAGPETRYSPFSGRLEPGDVLMVLSKCHTETTKQTKLQQGLAEALQSHLTLPAKDLVLVAQDCLETSAGSTDGGGGSVLLIKRSRS
jgi:serine phosphatase RsbU (regulator of sigma subunit)